MAPIAGSGVRGLWWMAPLWWSVGCGPEDTDSGPLESDSETDTAPDSDTDVDTDSDSDTDVDTDSDSDTDTDTDTDSDTDTDTDVDVDVDWRGGWDVVIDATPPLSVTTEVSAAAARVASRPVTEMVVMFLLAHEADSALDLWFDEQAGVLVPSDLGASVLDTITPTIEASWEATGTSLDARLAAPVPSAWRLHGDWLIPFEPARGGAAITSSIYSPNQLLAGGVEVAIRFDAPTIAMRQGSSGELVFTDLAPGFDVHAAARDVVTQAWLGAALEGGFGLNGIVSHLNCTTFVSGLDTASANLLQAACTTAHSDPVGAHARWWGTAPEPRLLHLTSGSCGMPTVTPCAVADGDFSATVVVSP